MEAMVKIHDLLVCVLGASEQKGKYWRVIRLGCLEVGLSTARSLRVALG